MSGKKNTHISVIGAGNHIHGIRPLQGSEKRSLTVEGEDFVISAIDETRKKLNPRLKPNYVSLTIYQAAKRYPDSLSKSFYLNNDPTCYYFAIGEPKAMRDNEVITQIKVLQLELESGHLTVTDLDIKVETIINAVTILEFYQKTVDCYNILITKFRKDEDWETQKKIRTYHSFSLIGKKIRSRHH